MASRLFVHHNDPTEYCRTVTGQRSYCVSLIAYLSYEDMLLCLADSTVTDYFTYTKFYSSTTTSIRQLYYSKSVKNTKLTF